MLIDTSSTGDQQQRRIEPLGVVGTFARLGDPIYGDGIDQDIQRASQEAEPGMLMASPCGKKGNVDSRCYKRDQSSDDLWFISKAYEIRLRGGEHTVRKAILRSGRLYIVCLH